MRLDKNILLFIFIIFVNVYLVSGSCDDGQVDINSASLKELDKLDGIGKTKAQAIIDSRPFDSVDDLVDVAGIGDATLEKIISQGLACVSDEDKEIDRDIVKDNLKESELVELKNEETKSIINLNSPVVEKQEYEVVYESRDGKISKYAIYGFSLFLVLIIIVLLFWR